MAETLDHDLNMESGTIRDGENRKHDTCILHYSQYLLDHPMIIVMHKSDDDKHANT